MATLSEYELRFLAILAAERAERAESNPPALLPMPAYSSGPDKTGGEGPVVLERTVGDVVLKKAWREAIHSSSSAAGGYRYFYLSIMNPLFNSPLLGRGYPIGFGVIF